MISSISSKADELIYDWFGEEKQICIMFSGGLDSLCYKKLFDRAGIAIPTISFNLIFQQKLINARSAANFKTSNFVLDFDIEQHFKSQKFWDFLEKNRCCSPQLGFFYCQQEICREMGYYPILCEFNEPVYIGEQIFLEVKHKSDYFFKQRNFAGYKYSDFQKTFIADTKHLRFDKNNKKDWFDQVFGISVPDIPKYHNFEDDMELDKNFRTQIFETFGFTDDSTFIEIDQVDDSVPINMQVGSIVVRNPIDTVHHEEK